MARQQQKYAEILRNPSFVNHRTGKRTPNDTGWQDRHMAALRAPVGFEAAIVSMLAGWATYADQHRARYESRVTDDGVMGDEWTGIGRSILALLNGETGRLDCGTLDGFIRDTLASEGVNAS